MEVDPDKEWLSNCPYCGEEVILKVLGTKVVNNAIQFEIDFVNYDIHKECMENERIHGFSISGHWPKATQKKVNK